MTDPRQTVTISMIVTGVLVTLDELVSGRIPTPRIYIALISTFFALVLLAQVAPQLAGPLAMLVVIVALLTRGPNVLRKLSGGRS